MYKLFHVDFKLLSVGISSAITLALFPLTDKIKMSSIRFSNSTIFISLKYYELPNLMPTENFFLEAATILVNWGVLYFAATRSVIMGLQFSLMEGCEASRMCSYFCTILSDVTFTAVTKKPIF